VAGSSRDASAEPSVSSLASSPITIYGAKWCSACRALERGLTDRKISFEVIDVDDNPSAFARARASANASSAIPLTSIVRSSNTVWIVGSDVDGVERAQRGE
jgi:glutaredoxin